MRRRGALFLTAGVLALAGCGAESGRCGDEQVRHCYGAVLWENVDAGGFGAHIQNARITPGRGAFVTNEIWALQRGSCGDSRFPGCWIEAGQYAQHDQRPHYFWGEMRPSGGFDLHFVRDVSDAAMGRMVLYFVGVGSDGRWYVLISGGPDISSHVARAETTPRPNQWIIGQELAGTDAGAAAPPALFDRVLLGDARTLTRSPLPHDGSMFRTPDHSPVQIRWLRTPTQGGGDGGLLETRCC